MQIDETDIGIKNPGQLWRPAGKIDVLHKNYILELYKMTIEYSVQILKKLQYRCEALRAVLSGF